MFILGYALLRFPLELARGDSAQPYYRGLSQAQWIALASSVGVLEYRPTLMAFAAPRSLDHAYACPLIARSPGWSQ